MSDSTWPLIEMRNNLKKDIEVTPFVAVLNWKTSIKLKTEKLSEVIGMTKAITLRNWLNVLKRQHLSVIWEKFINSPRS